MFKIHNVSKHDQQCVDECPANFQVNAVHVPPKKGRKEKKGTMEGIKTKLREEKQARKQKTTMESIKNYICMLKVIIRSYEMFSIMKYLLATFLLG